MKMMSFTNPQNKNLDSNSLIKLLIGEDYEWKIGDMDHKLNGNINLD